MAYSESLRKKVVQWHEAGESMQQIARRMSLSSNTVYQWITRHRNGESLKNKKHERSWRKIDPDKVMAYLKKHPDAYQYEIAEALGVSRQGISCVMKKLKMTKKKENSLSRKR